MTAFGQAWSIVKGQFGEYYDDLYSDAGFSVSEWDPWYEEHFGGTPHSFYGEEGEPDEHLAMYDDPDEMRFYRPETVDAEVLRHSKFARPEAVQSYPGLDAFRIAPVFTDQAGGGDVGRRLMMNPYNTGILSLLGLDAIKEGADEYDVDFHPQIRATLQHELGHAVASTIESDADFAHSGDDDTHMPPSQFLDWIDDDEEGLVEEMPLSIQGLGDNSRWDEISDWLRRRHSL